MSKGFCDFSTQFQSKPLNHFSSRELEVSLRKTDIISVKPLKNQEKNQMCSDPGIHVLTFVCCGVHNTTELTSVSPWHTSPWGTRRLYNAIIFYNSLWTWLLKSPLHRPWWEKPSLGSQDEQVQLIYLLPSLILCSKNWFPLFAWEVVWAYNKYFYLSFIRLVVFLS